MRNPRIRASRVLVGALVGFLAAAPLTALLYLAWRVLSTPFTPFDLFDRLARVLPGPLVTFGIDGLVTVLNWVAPGSVAELAKPAEQGLAVAIFIVCLALLGAVVFAAGRLGPTWPMATALAAGGLAGVGAIGLAGAGGVSFASEPASAAWLLLAFLAWGVAVGRSWHRLAAPAPGSARDAEAVRLDRRRFLVRLGSATAVLTAMGAGVGALVGRIEEEVQTPTAASNGPQPWSATHRLPNAGADLAPAPGTRPELTPLDDHYRIDINTVSPDVDGSTWRLRVHGLVDAPQAYTLEDLRALPALDQFVTLSCISNRVAGDLISTQRWTGVSLQDLLPAWGLAAEASHLMLRAADGFYEVVSLDEVRSDARVMLAYAWDGLPLRREHGFPLRIYIPDRYGMKQPKWIESIEVMDHWEPGYWVERGWSREAIMKATSVIDTVATESLLERDGRTLVPIGGIAHAGVRGISRVDVRVDEGPWEQARLRQPLSGQTWVLWRFDWPFAAGSHTFTVRCTDGDGTMQVVEPSPVRPDGATGLHRLRRQLPGA
jgi:DMSO/TMAO reductase YedYZ molybdopterin-dependent catalytic subunit